MRRTLLGLAVLLGLVWSSPADAQSLRACTDAVTAAGVSSDTVVATLPAGNSAKGGRFIYVCSVHIVQSATGPTTGQAGPGPVCTATNLQPNNLVWWGDYGQSGTGVQKVVISRDWATGLRTAKPETPFSVSCTNGPSTQLIRINLTGFYGP